MNRGDDMRVDNNFGFDFSKSLAFKDKMTKENASLIKQEIDKRDQEIKKLFEIDQESKNKISESEERRILRKLARGEKLTPKEKEKAKKIEPEKMQKAQMAKQRKDQIERALKAAKSKEDQARILSSAQMEVSMSADKDAVYSDLLNEAVSKAKSNSKKGKNSDGDSIELVGFDARV